MNRSRVVTAVIVGCVTLLFLMLGGFVLSASIVVVAILALKELYDLVIIDIPFFEKKIIYVLGFLGSTISILFIDFLGVDSAILLFFLNIVMLAIFSISVFESNSNILKIVMKQIFGLVYIPFSLSTLILIRKFFDGFIWSVTVVCIVSAGDVGAYYFGKLLGRRKLAPNISPNKTIEGFIAGVLCSLVVAFAFKIYFFSFVSVTRFTAFAAIVGIMAHIGDLFASSFKRMAGVKDSGKILPGHGGVLDRIDGLLFAMPTAYFFLLWLIGLSVLE